MFVFWQVATWHPPTDSRFVVVIVGVVVALLLIVIVVIAL